MFNVKISSIFAWLIPIHYCTVPPTDVPRRPIGGKSASLFSIFRRAHRAYQVDIS